MLAKFLKAALLWVSALIVLLLIAFAISAHWPIPAAQRQALAQLRQPPPPLRGPNLFAALWALPYAVPPAQQQVLLAQDVQRAGRSPAGMPLPGAAARYPRQPAWPAKAPALCNWSDANCLEQVRAQPQAYADALATQAALLAQLRSLGAYGDYRSPFPPGDGAALPAVGLLKVSMTGNALDFAQGRSDAALSGVCTDAQVARVLLRSGDNLIMPLIGVAMLHGSAQEFAAMLAELPAQHPLPAHCAAAFAPLPVDDVRLCNAMQGEAHMVFAMLQQSVDAQPAASPSWSDELSVRLFDLERTQALMAPGYAWACGEPLRALLERDLPVPQTLIPAPDTASVACLANAAGCVLASVGPASAATAAIHQRKLQDVAAELRAVSAVLWLRAHPSAQPLAQRIAELPSALRGQSRPIQPSADGLGLQWQRYARGEQIDGMAHLPLAASRTSVMPAAASVDR
ncbi:hypothetical protein [Xanthomonas sp. 3075]|uniref:hypothetical protein n=1 Tax=Xanthomonas sp. 3075 TaxID=3035315 RepID=UPI00161BC6D6|nr:hypothetical protein [Xanthomonas sp. 3075]MBB4129377.1 hypothetical protein [Xanthomonas sp. 3075]